MSDSAYISVNDIDDFVNKIAAGSAVNSDSDISLTLRLPDGVAADDLLVLLIEGPNGSANYRHRLTPNEVALGVVSIHLPNRYITDGNQGYVDGDYRLSLAVLAGGNAYTVYPGEAAFTLDTIATAPPVVGLLNDTGLANNDWVSNDGTLAVAANETTSTIEYSIDGGSTWTKTQPVAVEGVNALQVREVDQAGNPSLAAVLEFTLDLTAPTLLTDTITTNNTSPELSGRVDDPAAEVVVTIGSHEYIAVNNGDGTWSIAAGTIATLTDAITTVLVNATDVAGNEAAASGQITLDVQAPVINDQEFSYQENQSANGLVATIVASDNTALAEFKFEHQDGSLHSLSEDGYFSIDSNGQVFISSAGVASGANDFEVGDTQHGYTVAAIDAVGNKTLADIVLTETNVHEGVSSVSVADIEAIEGGQALFSIALSNVASGAVLGFDFIDGTALQGSDFNVDVYEYSLDAGNTWLPVPASQSISLADEGDYNIQVRVDVVADNLPEMTEQFEFKVQVINPGAQTAVIDTALVTIINNSVTAVDDRASADDVLDDSNSSTAEKNISNSYSIDEKRSDVEGLGDGGYVVVWQGKDSNCSGIYAQKYDASGHKIDGAYLVNSTQTGNQTDPAATDLGAGKYLVTWTDTSTSPNSIRGQIMDADNQFSIGDEFVVSYSNSVSSQAVGGLDDGGFIVTWASRDNDQQDDSGYGIFGQRYSADGDKVGIAFLVNQATRSDQEDPDVALVNGKLVVTWTGSDKYCSDGVFLREFDIDYDIETRSDNFENGVASGWSNAGLTDGGDAASLFLGQLGRDQSSSKTYDFGVANAGRQVEISFDFYEIDSWDYERFLVYINGTEVSDDKFSHGRMEGNSQSLGQIEGTAGWEDTVSAYAFTATLDAQGQLLLGFSSTLNQSVGDESFGIDNIVINTTAVTAAGDEQPVNTTTRHGQDESSITALTDGAYVVSWTSYGQDGRCNGVYLQKFDSAGNKVGSETQINTTFNNNQDESSITSLPGGGYVVTWTSYGQDGNCDGIFAQRFSSAGLKLGAEVQVNDTSHGNQKQPSITSLEDGSYVISWTGYNAENSSYDIYSKRYDCQGEEYREALAFTEKNVTSTEQVNEKNSAVAGLDDGGHIVVWQGKDANCNGIYAQRYDANGDKIDAAYLVNSTENGNQTDPVATDLGGGKYLVTWTDTSTSPNSIRGQIIAADNQPSQNNEFVVSYSNSVTTQAVGGLQDGGFIITWASRDNDQQDDSGYGIFGQRYSADGQKVGIAFLINQTTQSDQSDPDVALVDGNLVVTWTGSDESGAGVFTRQFEIDYGVQSIGDNFEDGMASGWSNAGVSDGGAAASLFLGQLGRDHGSSKTYDFGVQSAGRQVEISFDFYEIDSWDGERFFVYINGDEVSDDSFRHWHMEANSQSLGQIDGTARWQDTVTAYAFTATLDAQGKLALGFAASLNQSLNDESFGIDNIVINTTAVTAVSGEQKINTTTRHDQHEADVTTLTDGGYVVAWSSNGQDGSGEGVYLQKFDGGGNKIGNEIQVNTVYAHDQESAAVASLPDGGYVVTWVSNHQDGSQGGIYAQRFAADGTTLGAEVRVNDTTEHRQHEVSIDSLATGGYVISWTGYSEQSGSHDIYTKVYNSSGAEFTATVGYSLEKNTQLVFSISDLLANDSDAEGDDFALVSVQAGHHGRVELQRLPNGENQIVFIAAQDYTGEASFTYTIADEHGATDTATVFLDVVDNRVTPLILDLDKDGVETLHIDRGVLFDLDADGSRDNVGWVGQDDGLLVRDINGDGLINDGSELFGENTRQTDSQTAINGFAALSDLDANHDGVFDQADDAYAEVMVWRDLNSDGVSQAHELSGLMEAGVESIVLAAVAVDELNNGNWSGLRSAWIDTTGEKNVIDDVWLSIEAAGSHVVASADLLSDDFDLDSLEQYFQIGLSAGELSEDNRSGCTAQRFASLLATEQVGDGAPVLGAEYSDMLDLLGANYLLAADF